MKNGGVDVGLLYMVGMLPVLIKSGRVSIEPFKHDDCIMENGR